MKKMMIASIAVVLLVSGCGDKDDVVSGTTATSAFDKAMESAGGAMSDIKGAADTAVDSARSMGTDAVNAADAMARDAIDGAKTMASDAVDAADEMTASAKSALGESAEAVKQSAADAASQMTAAVGGGASGQSVYQKNCQACHAAGVAGSPKLGDKAAWAPRIATGIDAMVASAINGKGIMPARGACASCTDEEIKAAVIYMIDESR